MAMGRAVICSRTPGQTDVVVDSETGIYVPPGDAQALREAIEYLLYHPEIAERMGQAGRRRIEQSMNLESYVERLGHVVQTVSM
jgi:glycosyltransferase involved in cell wall biosynthesis